MDFCAIADICARMDAHEGQAAWAQGFFSVLAIVAAIVIERATGRRERRQREELQENLGLAFLTQAAYVLRYSEIVHTSLSQGPSDDVPLEAQYKEWVSVATDHTDILKILIERTTEPDLLMAAVPFMRAARPPSAPTTLDDGTPLHALSVWERVEAMKSAYKHLQKAVGE